MMTLTTCNPKWDNYQRMVIHAELVSSHTARGRPASAARELTDVRMDLANAAVRHLPGKLIGSLLLIAGFGLLWYVVFPAIDPLLPFDDVQVTATSTGG